MASFSTSTPVEQNFMEHSFFLLSFASSPRYDSFLFGYFMYPGPKIRSRFLFDSFCSRCLVCHIKHSFFLFFVVFVSLAKIVNFLLSFVCRVSPSLSLFSLGTSVINTYFSLENYQLMHYIQ